jgi:hypothetical protein
MSMAIFIVLSPLYALALVSAVAMIYAYIEERSHGNP